MRKLWVVVVSLSVLSSGKAFAGGYEIPDNGTEALGRGGAFVAKADDPTALQYNIAGMARQRGSRILINGNLTIHDLAFTREGSYPGDPKDVRTPWAGQPYPTVHDADRVFFAPFLGVTTDFNFFKRWTFGFGVYGPPSVGKHDYPRTVKLANGMTAPNPARYDLANSDVLLIFPTLAAAVKLVKYLDVGVAVQLVVATIKQGTASISNLGRSNCPTPDYPGCDSYANVNVSGLSGTVLLSALAHPTDFIDIGLTFRPPIPITANGTLIPEPPPVSPTDLGNTCPGKGTPCPPQATITTGLPAYLRLGVRGVLRYPDGSEKADLEVDGLWENWSSNYSIKLHSEDLPVFGPLDAEVLHNYKDTFGLRVGGAYNFRINDTARFTTRLGFYFDSAATAYQNTRLDFVTSAKYGLTLGAGIKLRGFTFNLAYAYVYSPSRVVSNSESLALSSFNGTPVPGRDPIIVVGNGRYDPMIHVLSFGVTINIDEFRKNAPLMTN